MVVELVVELGLGLGLKAGGFLAAAPVTRLSSILRKLI